mgnify:CR=1 FL=1
MNNILTNNNYTDILEIKDQEYWFVRTDNGDNYESFLRNGFIGIGWNEITVEDLRKIDVYGESIRQKIIANPENRVSDLKGSSQKAKISSGLISALRRSNSSS